MKKQTRKKNPVGMSKAQKIKAAMRLYSKFRITDPEFIQEINVPDSGVFIAIGRCDAIEYTTERGGKVEAYRHEFKGDAAPLLASSYDGNEIILLGGDCEFTERGIIDRGYDD